MGSPSDSDVVQTEPLVSSIVIFLNAEAYLEEAIKSVFAQTYTSWELLLVDDGSSDSSTATAQRCARDFPDRVRYLDHPRHENLGMSATRNLGMRHARGEYIAFLDADDVWLAPKLAEQVAILEREPRASMVYGRTLMWYSWNKRSDVRMRDHTIELGVLPNTLIFPPALTLLLLANRTQGPTTCNALIRRRIVEEIGGFEESFRGMYEDHAFFAKLQLRAPVYVADACWAKYRQHNESCTAHVEHIADYYGTRRPLLNWLMTHLTKEGFDADHVVWRALQKELWRANHPRCRQLIDLPRRLRKWARAIRTAFSAFTNVTTRDIRRGVRGPLKE